MEIVETLWPGLGVRYDIETHAKQIFSVLVRRDGGADIATFSAEDPDEALVTMTLQEDEVAALAELLGAPRVSKRMADLTKEIPGLHSARIEIQAGSPFEGRTLGDTRARTLTGCSVVAIVRGHDVLAAPSPATVLTAGDILVAIGDEGGLTTLGEILATGHPGE